MDADRVTFPVSTFRRVFDTVPTREVLTLAELVACFRRFELKPALATRIERELLRIDHALDAARAGDATGERVAQLVEAARKARATGGDPELAMRARAEELRVAARMEAKRDLRLWSPAWYRDGCTERGSEGVVQLSCLVLDYDGGVRIPEATAPWTEWFHMLHTTWSHTVEHPKLRLILPLAVPVPASEWDGFWHWAYGRCGGDADRALSGVAATFALPAVPRHDWPREALAQPGPLLDPREFGVTVGTPLRLPVLHSSPSLMLGDPEKEYVTHDTSDAVYVYDDPTLDDELEHEGRATLVEPIAAAAVSARESLPLLAPAPETNDAPVLAPPALRRRAPAKKTRARLKTLVIDFDGVLHSYRSGWKGATVIPDPPVPGAIEWLTHAVERFEVAVLSARSRETGGIDAMRDWLRAAGLTEEVLSQVRFPKQKQPADVYLDDRAWRFEGQFPTLDDIDAFVPWHQRDRG